MLCQCKCDIYVAISFVLCADQTFEFKAIYESLALGLHQSKDADSLHHSSVSPACMVEAKPICWHGIHPTIHN